MRKILFISALAVVGLVWVANPGKAQDKTPATYEYAILKWDGPDRIFTQYTQWIRTRAPGQGSENSGRLPE